MDYYINKTTGVIYTGDMQTGDRKLTAKEIKAFLNPPVTKEEQELKREFEYRKEVDPITCHILRLQDEKNPNKERIEELKLLRDEKVKEIQEKYPYPKGE